MLAELVIGDAYGRSFEHAKRHFVFKKNDDVTHYVRPPDKSHLAGHYSANAQGALGITELVLSGRPWTHFNCAESILSQFKFFRRYGISEQLQGYLVNSFSAGDFFKHTSNSMTDGAAAVRVCPLGLFPCLHDVLERSKVAAEITHGKGLSLKASQAAAAMVYFARYRPKANFRIMEFMRDLFPNLLQVPLVGSVTDHVMMVVSAALTAFVRNVTTKELLWDCVNMGGPSGLTGALALAAASVSPEYKQNLPETLFSGLEGGARGREYIGRLDKQLLKITTKSY